EQDRKVESSACSRDSADTTHELAHDLRPLGIAEIEIVSDGERFSPDGGYIAPTFCNRLFAAFEWIGLAVARRNIRGEGETFRAILDTNDRGLATLSLHPVSPDYLIL